MNKDKEMINKYLNRINEYLNRINEYINIGNELPEYIYNELIDIKNILENESISIEDRNLKCVLLDDLFYKINALLDSNGNSKRRR